MASVTRAFNIDHITGLYDFKDRNRTVEYYIRLMLNRTQKMFKYENLPKTINKMMLETYLQMGGWAYITEVDGNLYAFTGGLGGVLNEYYLPTEVVISNPYLKYYKTLNIVTDGVLMTNDSMWLGLYDLYNKYATLLTESEISLRMCNINTRIQNLISAPDDSTRKSAEKYLNDLEDGKIGVIAENGFFDGIKAHSNLTSSNQLTQNIEYHQYLKASFYNELGLNANFNMKREAINSNESELNKDALKPLIDDMLEVRQEGVKKINEKYGTNIKVELDSSWRINEMEVEVYGETGVENPDNSISELDDAGNISETETETDNPVE